MSDRLSLRRGPLELLLAPALGGSVLRFDWCGAGERLPILRGNEDAASPLETGCFPLVPYCNRIRGGRFVFQNREVRIAPNMAGDPSPLHGQGWLGGWEVVEASDAEAELRFSHDAGEWPWDYEARQRFQLREDRLEAELVCENRSEEPMPCGLGFHPYFPCLSGTELATQVENVWTIDEAVLPVERVPAHGRYDLSDGPACGRDLDNGFDGWGGVARIATPGQPVRVEMSSPDAGFFQLYSPADGSVFVAEPVSHANAALNEEEARWPELGLRALRPGETMRLRMTIAVLPAG